MTTAGLQIINDNHTTLFDNLTNALTLQYKGSSAPSISGYVSPIIAISGSTYYLFALQETSPSESGLLVYAPDGTVAFDALQKFARVVDVVGGVNYLDGLGTRTYTSGRQYAVAFLRPTSHQNTYTWSGMDGPYVETIRVVGDVSGNQVTFEDVTTHNALPPPPDGSNPTISVIDQGPWQAAVLDVTGY
jgi:hypothetical protein